MQVTQDNCALLGGLIVPLTVFLRGKVGMGWTQVFVCFSPALAFALATAVVTRPPTQEHWSDTMAHKVDPYEGIDFEEINEATDLADDEIKCLKNCFDLFDSKKQTFLSADDLDEILRAMGFRPSAEELKAILEEIDEDGSGEIEFAEFCQLCAKFLVEDPDIETLKRELKAAFRFFYFWFLLFYATHFFRIYDKNGEGFITMDTLRGLISELLQPLSKEELDGIIDELDEDGSGTMDFDEFCEMMMSAPEN